MCYCQIIVSTLHCLLFIPVDNIFNPGNNRSNLYMSIYHLPPMISVRLFPSPILNLESFNIILNVILPSFPYADVSRLFFRREVWEHSLLDYWDFVITNGQPVYVSETTVIGFCVRYFQLVVVQWFRAVFHVKLCLLDLLRLLFADISCKRCWFCVLLPS